jgi:hypothetical protein
MPKELNIDDCVYHHVYQAGTVVGKIGPTFVKTLNETVEATYLVRFGGRYVSSLYADELLWRC